MTYHSSMSFAFLLTGRILLRLGRSRPPFHLGPGTPRQSCQWKIHLMEATSCFHVFMGPCLYRSLGLFIFDGEGIVDTFRLSTD